MHELDLIQALKDSTYLPNSEAESVVNLLCNEMDTALGNGDRIEIRNLCSLFERIY